VVMVVVGLVAVVIVAVPGLAGEAMAVHVPVPVPAIVAVPPGRVAQLTTWSGPALGLAVTTMDAVSVQPEALVHTKPYVPGAV
jgi:hypothetical protein